MAKDVRRALVVGWQPDTTTPHTNPNVVVGRLAISWTEVRGVNSGAQ